jgi:aminoglycoside 6'-N-acetyltransferase
LDAHPSPPLADAVAHDDELVIRRLRDDPADMARMARWLNEPHVKQWWNPDEPPMTAERAAAKYRERAHPSSPTTPCVVELSGRPIGYMQFYRWASWSREAEVMSIPFGEGSYGVDIFIGETDALDDGLGSHAVDLLCRHLFDARDASDVTLTTELANPRAQRAYEKAGFRKVAQVLDLDTRGGKRVTCWLMRREPSVSR